MWDFEKIFQFISLCAGIGTLLIACVVFGL